MPFLLTGLGLVEQIEQGTRVAAAAVDFGFECLFHETAPVAGCEVNVEAHGTVECAGMEVVEGGVVVAYAKEFLLAGCFEVGGFFINLHQDFAEALDNGFE